MIDKLGPVAPKNGPICPLKYHATLVAGISRIAAKNGKGNTSDNSGRTPKALGKLFSGDSMDTTGQGLLDFLRADATALDEVLALYGYGLHRLPEAQPDNGRRMAEVLDFAAADQAMTTAGKSDPRSICQLADKARPVAQHCMGIVAQADRIKGFAA